ncbi:MAG: hydantoinase/oxoprolinase family protein, partial [Halioglobus sp.]|nr:hydantoinase/oxoprolinase family protein [Halioglobus sp.]
LTLLAYGGNGPVFAAIQAQELGIDRVLVPRTSPGFSATGALTARPGIDEERAYLAPASAASVERLRELWLELDARAESFLTDAGFARDAIQCRYQINMRYPGQNWSLTVDAFEVTGARDLASADDALVTRLVERFHALHLAEYGHARQAEAPEITGVRLVAATDIPGPALSGGSTAARVTATPHRQRRANLGEGFAPTDIYRGADLAPGCEVPGPAIIEEQFTTIVVYPGWTAHMDDAGDIELNRTG